MLRPDELEQLSRLLAGELSPEEEARLWAECEARPELAEGLARLQALDGVVAGLASTPVPAAAVERAITRATQPRASGSMSRWLVAAAAVVLAAGLAWVLSGDDAPPAPAPPVEARQVERRVASVISAPGSVLFEEGEGVARLVSGTALFDGEWVVVVDGERLTLRGKVALSTNPPEGLAHVTTLVTPTPEESDMIRSAAKQWATATTLAVLVFSGEVLAQTKVSAGQAWAKKPVEKAKPTAVVTPQKDSGEPGCESCVPTTDRPGTFEVQLGSSPSLGPADAKVTVVIFSEAECPFCVKSHEVLKELQKQYAGRVRFVFKHFPLPRHAGARQAAIALHAAAAQGRFWEMVESAYGSPVSAEEGLYDAQARALGLDLQQYRRDVASPATAAVIDADIAEGKRLGVQGVPAWFINGQEVVGHRPLETMRQLIDAQLAK